MMQRSGSPSAPDPQLEEGGARTRTVYIVRHGERVDEADPEAWELLVRAERSERCYHDLYNDPPLTESGRAMAQLAADALETIAPAASFRRIYCSRMRRCIQTAIPIALKFGLPIHLSKTVSLSAVGVLKSVQRKGSYDYCSMVEIRSFCPEGVVLVECKSTSLRSSSRESARHKVADWRETVLRFAGDELSTLVVAHRETIRGFIASETKTKMPYCCVGEFTVSADSLCFGTLYDMNGARLL